MQKKNKNKEKGQTVGGRVLRGGSWNNQSDNLRCAARNNDNPWNNWNNNGFRVVRVAVPNHTYRAAAPTPRAVRCVVLARESEPDAGVSRNTGLAFRYDIRPFLLRSSLARASRAGSTRI